MRTFHISYKLVGFDYSTIALMFFRLAKTPSKETTNLKKMTWLNTPLDVDMYCLQNVSLACVAVWASLPQCGYKQKHCQSTWWWISLWKNRLHRSLVT